MEVTTKGWRVTYPWRAPNNRRASDGRWKSHVYPENDLREHDHGAEGTCWCEPTVTQESHEADVVVHHSEDGRELVEQYGLQ